MEIVNENEYLENLNKRYGRRSICSRASRTSLLSRYCTPKSNSNFNSED